MWTIVGILALIVLAPMALTVVVALWPLIWRAAALIAVLFGIAILAAE